MGESAGRLVGTEINQPKRDIPMGVLMGAQNGRHMGDCGVHMGDKVGEREGDLFVLNGCSILAKTNAHDTIGGMGDRGCKEQLLEREIQNNGIAPKWSMGDRGSKEQLLDREIQNNGIAPKWSMGDRGSKEQMLEQINGRDTSETAAGGGLLGPIEGDKPPAGANTSKEVKSWKSLVSIPVKSGSPLQFYRPHCANGKLVAKPPAEAVNEGIDMWKGCLVGQFLDKRLPFPVVRSLVNRLWGKREMPDISTTGNGLFFFRFKDPEARDWVMNAGPWHLAGRPFILRAWKPGMDMLNIQLSSIPIWVRFYNIPLEYWTSTCLGHIASTVGIPLHLDPLTENQTKLSFARICVEVGVDCEFPTSVLLDRGNGNYSTIKIEYPWAPQCCTECKLFGHNMVNCPVKKGPSNGQVSTIYGNSKHEAVIRKDNHDAAGSSICAVANPIVMHAAAEMPTMSDSPIVMHAAAEMPTISDSPVTHEEAGFSLDAMDSSKAIEVDAPTKLHGNTFACLTQNEEEDPNEEEGPLPTPTAHTDFSDTSPIIDTFRHIKRVDELDFTPVPLSRKKLKKLKKLSPVNSQDPGIRGTLPNG